MGAVREILGSQPYGKLFQVMVAIGSSKRPLLCSQFCTVVEEPFEEARLDFSSLKFLCVIPML